MSETRFSLLRSLSVRAVALLVVLLLLPALLYSIYARIETERRALLLTAVRDAGTAIATGLAPELSGLEPADFGTVGARLARFADPRRQVALLFHPTGSAADQQFFLVAAVPQVDAGQIAAERSRLASLDVLGQLARSCTGGTPLTERVSAKRGGDSVITSVTAVAGTAGCWAVVISVNAADEVAGIADRPVKVRQALALAGAVYALMALLILVIFASIWTNLRRYRHRALAPDQAGGFLQVTDVPEMAPVARAIDTMVLRLRNGAELLRQAAEDNAHAFKGPIATIRHAVEPLRGPAVPPEALGPALAAVQASLDRLDGLVQSVGRLDAAAADLLEMAEARVDLSMLLRELVADSRTAQATRRVGITESLPTRVIVLGAAEALESIFENLLDNALSFSPAGGIVRVVLTAGDGMALVKVEDDGPGVPETALTRIFDRYYSDRRAMPRDTASAVATTTHFGIGLWIARQNARALGGDIIAMNRMPQGLSMRVRLKLAEAGNPLVRQRNARSAVQRAAAAARAAAAPETAPKPAAATLASADQVT